MPSCSLSRVASSSSRGSRYDLGARDFHEAVEDVAERQRCDDSLPVFDEEEAHVDSFRVILAVFGVRAEEGGRAKRVRPRRRGVQPIELRGEGNEAREPVNPLHAKTSDVLRQGARWPELLGVSREALAEVPEAPVQCLYDGRPPGESLGEGLITVVPFTAHPIHSDCRHLRRQARPPQGSRHRADECRRHGVRAAHGGAREARVSRAAARLRPRHVPRVRGSPPVGRRGEHPAEVDRPRDVRNLQVVRGVRAGILP